MRSNGVTLGLRFVALIIDYGTALGVWAAMMELASAVSKLGDLAGLLSFFVLLPLALVSPILAMGIPTGLKGRTLGKWICRLRVTGQRGERVGILRGIGREALKALLIFTNIGAFISIYMNLTRGDTIHDLACATDVEFFGGLTETQKNWRKAHGTF